MTDVDQKLRETFEAVGVGVQVPPFDEMAFERKVGRARRRRTATLVAGVTAAAAVVAVAVVAVPPLVDRDRSDAGSRVAGQASMSLHPEALPAPLYYVSAGRLVAVTPDGEVHEIGRSEAVVGFTAEGVLAFDERSQLVWIEAASSGEGEGAYGFERGAGPVTLPAVGPVQSAALSGDGRYLAWVDLDDVVTVHDLKAREFRQAAQLGPSSYVAAVSERGVLVSEDGELRLLEADGAVDIPTKRDGYGWVSDTAGTLVAVADRDDVTRVYDVTPPDGRARLVDSVPGTGRLAPYAGAIVSVDGSVVRLYPADGEPGVLDGVVGTPQSAGWIDEDHAVVTSAEGGGTSVYVCPTRDMTCTRVAFSESDVRLAE